MKEKKHELWYSSNFSLLMDAIDDTTWLKPLEALVLKRTFTRQEKQKYLSTIDLSIFLVRKTRTKKVII